eukprot:CAMPEP_0184301208 /NCGR_PEP_ID=MMETSP1049-20130417/11460_1 /TAXON_ID=77928 /ORGANISM="Proteomonas sulcata, Strain CCMP704" /LENGTH=115 /DNA_ID=CAMNT_0026612145 /DNA_START=430 /DNA_END=777 /DNA_ORIENTATION=-
MKSVADTRLLLWPGRLALQQQHANIPKNIVIPERRKEPAMQAALRNASSLNVLIPLQKEVNPQSWVPVLLTRLPTAFSQSSKYSFPGPTLKVRAITRNTPPVARRTQQKMPQKTL